MHTRFSIRSYTNIDQQRTLRIIVRLRMIPSVRLKRKSYRNHVIRNIQEHLQDQI